MQPFLAELLTNLQQRPLLLLPLGAAVLISALMLYTRRRTPPPWNGLQPFAIPLNFVIAGTLTLLNAASESLARNVTLMGLVGVAAVLMFLDQRRTKRAWEEIKTAPPLPADQVASPQLLARIAFGTAAMLVVVGGVLVYFAGTSLVLAVPPLLAFAGAGAFVRIGIKKQRQVSGQGA